MRPAFAIIPLALMFTLLGPEPYEANAAITGFKSKVANNVSSAAFSLLPMTSAWGNKEASPSMADQANAQGIATVR